MAGDFVLEPWDEDEVRDADTCHHGVGFDEYCEDCEDEELDSTNGS